MDEKLCTRCGKEPARVGYKTGENCRTRNIKSNPDWWPIYQRAEVLAKQQYPSLFGQYEQIRTGNKLCSKKWLLVGGTREQVDLLITQATTTVSVPVTFEVVFDLIPLNQRRGWPQVRKPRPNQGGGERSMGADPVQAKLDRETEGFRQLVLLAEAGRLFSNHPYPLQVEDCHKFKKQVGCDARIWDGEKLFARVDIKGGHDMTKPQLSVAYSSADAGIPYYIFDPYTGQAMNIDRDTHIEWIVARVSAPTPVTVTQ